MKILWVKAGGLLPPDMGGKIRRPEVGAHGVEVPQVCGIEGVDLEKAERTPARKSHVQRAYRTVGTHDGDGLELS